MYSAGRLALKYLDYYFRASNGKGHGTHSPFVYQFIKQVLNDRQDYADYAKVESLRSNLLHDQRWITLEDFGAGSAVQRSDRRQVAAIAKHSAKPKKFGQLLYRMIRTYQPKTIVELGTSLGITTSYLALAHPGAAVYTLEGAGEVATIAREHFTGPDFAGVQQVTGNFDETLPDLLERLPEVDFCFVDGNHREEPTLRYFRQLLPHMRNESILVFDDIHWSKGMEAAWDSIKRDPAVQCSIDLFFIGIVFFRQEFREKQHFRIRF